VRLEPLVFDPGTGPLSGFLSLPDGAAWRDRGVVICAPIGYENVLHYRHLRVLARRLADAGRPTLRFDWRACGDSSGDDRDPGLVNSWIQSVSAAARTLQERTGVRAVDVIGLRIGATLAAAAAAADPSIGDVVLWAPFTSGRSYIREMRAFHRLAEKAVSRSPVSEAVEGQEASGFLLAPSTLDDLGTVDLLATGFAVAPRRVLLAGRDAPPDKALAEHLGAQPGLTVETGVLSGFGEVAMSWSDAPIPSAAFDAIEVWLAPGTFVSSPGGAQLHSGSDTLDVGDGVTERAVVLRPDDPAVGVVSIAGAGGDEQAADTWVVFLSNRYARRIGPNRLYTSFARRWAAQGVPSLRLDVRATGDSGGPEQETVRNMYSDEVIDDARVALAYLREEYGARRFLFVGLCSGAFAGFHAALAEPDVEGVVLIGVHMLVWAEEETSMTLASNLRRMAFRRVSVERLLRGQVPVLRVTKVALQSARMTIQRRAWATTQRLVGRDPVDPIAAEISDGLAALSRRSCSLLFIFPKHDPGIPYLKRYLGEGLVGLVDQPTFRLVEIADTDHTFRPLWSHDVLRTEIESELRDIGFLPAESERRLVSYERARKLA
jgi:pimeloyl-ACP methyl ester carboxylesterase